MTKEIKLLQPLSIESDINNEIETKMIKSTLSLYNTKTILQIDPIEEEIQQKKRLSQKNSFLAKQVKTTLFWSLFIGFFWTALLVGSITWIAFIIIKAQSFWFLSLPFVGVIISLVANFYLYKNYKTILNDYNNSFSASLSDKTVLPTLVKIYRKLSTRSVDVNWFSIGVYTFSALTSLFTFIITWAINLVNKEGSHFGKLVLANGTNNIPQLIIYALCGLTSLVFVIQTISTITRQSRISSIDSYYGFQLVPEVEIQEIKKFKNKRNKWIFITFLIIIFFIFYISYKLIRRQKSIKVTA